VLIMVPDLVWILIGAHNEGNQPRILTLKTIV